MRSSLVLGLGLTGALAVCPAARAPLAAQRAAASAASPLTFKSFGARLLEASDRGRHPDSNVVVSPVSAGLALSLTLLGARGRTAADLARALGLPGDDRRALERNGAAFLAATRGRTDVELEIASAVWVDSAARPTPGFAASAAAWRATVGSMDHASPDAVEAINRWAKRATHGKVAGILDQPLSNAAMLFVANAVYFKGKWLEPFDKATTRARDFTLTSGRRIRVPAMDRTGRIAYRREAGFQVVRLPYRGERVAMYVILPDRGTSLRALEQRFVAREWPASLAERDERDVHLVLPKLHVEQTHDLVPILSTLGAGVALDCRRADFRDMAVARARGKSLPLCIGKVAQTVYLDVDEEGTVAAAVTGAEILSDSSVAHPPLEFVVDRPFLFMLRDERTGANLFVGSIGRP
jgi:serpin B